VVLGEYVSAMALSVRRSSPAGSLGNAAIDYSEKCTELWIASAFLSSGAVDKVLAPARKTKARVRLLTGTFGRHTRKDTFRKLLRLESRGVKTHIWEHLGKGDFHAKVYLWRLPRDHAVAWIGSANLTDPGLRRSGELVLELRGRWDAPDLKKVRAAFDFEWERGTAIDKAFVRAYHEAPLTRPVDTPRSAPPVKRKGQRTQHPAGRPGKGRILVDTVSGTIQDDSPLDRRVRARFPETSGACVHSYGPKARTLKKGARVLLVDYEDEKIALLEVTDKGADGNATIYTHRPVMKRKQYVDMTAPLRKQLRAAGMKFRGNHVVREWLSPTVARAVEQVLYAGRKVPS
jgi:HKD family nuclease